MARPKRPKKKKLKKGIESIEQRIQEHIPKLEEAIEKGDVGVEKYYRGELHRLKSQKARKKKKLMK